MGNGRLCAALLVRETNFFLIGGGVFSVGTLGLFGVLSYGVARVARVARVGRPRPIAPLSLGEARARPRGPCRLPHKRRQGTTLTPSQARLNNLLGSLPYQMCAQCRTKVEMSYIATGETTPKFTILIIKR